MWKDIIVTIVSVAVSLAVVIALGLSAEACDKDDCDRRMDKYTSCMAWHGEKKCRIIKRVVEQTCGLTEKGYNNG